MNPNISCLLLDLTSISDKEAEQIVFDKYIALYLDRGVPPRRIGTKKTHDGLDCVFTESRFKHAFFRKEHYSKDKFDKLRGARIAWIEHLIAGKIQKTECWVVPPKVVLGTLEHALAIDCTSYGKKGL